MELLEALKVIRNTCGGRTKCGDCPLRLRDRNECEILYTSPCNWKLKDDQDKVPRVFE